MSYSILNRVIQGSSLRVFSSSIRSLRTFSSSIRSFQLDQVFIDHYQRQPAPFPNALGELVYRRTYSRTKDDGTNEQWSETVERVVNGTYNMQRDWLLEHGLEWDAVKAQYSAQEMFERMFQFKFLPPGRGLWAMGSPLTEERKIYAALNNCAFVSTHAMNMNKTVDGESSIIDLQTAINSSSWSSSPASRPFTFLMDAAMLGVGVGFDTLGAGTVKVIGPRTTKSKSIVYQIPDSREGWVQCVGMLLDSYFHGLEEIDFSYDLIRPLGAPIKGFGGVSSGHEPLKQLVAEIRSTLDPMIGQDVSVTCIVDLMNLIGKCVVAGNVRRTAEIAFGEYDDVEYLNLKNYKINPHRMEYGWTSNNSVFAHLGMDYEPICERVRDNGEPGFAWLDNMRNYGRMNGVLDPRDSRAMGGNPCLEQTLESYELCCLVETFPHHHDSVEDFIETLKYAYLYGKTVTLGKTQWPETNRVMLRNRRIGCSVSGIAQFLAYNDIEVLRQWLEQGYESIQQYDREYSEWFAIPRSIKTTSVKPSGTVSLLAGATPGVHFPEAEYYIRRVRFPKDSELCAPLIEAGYPVEPAVDAPDSTVVVEIPMSTSDSALSSSSSSSSSSSQPDTTKQKKKVRIRTAPEVSMWEQLSLAAFMQRHWSDNQVSCTVTFDPKTEAHQLSHALDYFQYQMKGVSFLPRLELGAYPQMPYEKINQDEYSKRIDSLKIINFADISSGDEAIPDRFCDSDTCGIGEQAPSTGAK